jgi:hypothetical protein
MCLYPVAVVQQLDTTCKETHIIQKVPGIEPGPPDLYPRILTTRPQSSRPTTSQKICQLQESNTRPLDL